MTKKKIFEKQLFSDDDGFRFATPWPVAEYRAKRLKCSILADISCGIGGQTIYFAKECEVVYAVEINPVKLEIARKNCQLFGLDNVKFICGDALSKNVIDQIPEVDIVFSDPARPATEEERNISKLIPDIAGVLRAYSQKTEDFAFEVPPQLPPHRIPFDCEMEYLSLNGELNRLNLYFGNLKSCIVSALALPGQIKICKKNGDDEKATMNYTNKAGTYLYEPDPAIIKAELLPEFLKNLTSKADIFHIDHKRLMLTSNHNIKHSMIKNSYRVVHCMRFIPQEINKELKKRGYGTVLLRAEIAPSMYWNIRNKLEKNLKGEKKAILFKKGELAYICENIS
ncbi:MAG: methyltransferase domain-containing protein [Methanomethylovorans sp.]|nr:methyltransferase domain-containing protein [Methanomethylovorans sp.]